MLLVSLSGDSGGDGQEGSWRKTSSESSCDASASRCCWSPELVRLDSEIRREDIFCWVLGGDGVVLLQSVLLASLRLCLSVPGDSLGPAAVTSSLVPGQTMASRLT